MNLQDLKDQFIERAKEYGNKIAESETGVKAVEAYKNLSPTMQKLSTIFVIVLGLYLVYSIPAGFVNASKEYEASFSRNRNLIRGLYRSARNPPIAADRFSGQDFTAMKSSVETVASGAQVIETQKGTFSPAARPLPMSKVPDGIKQTGMTFELKKLNLKQVVNISEQISVMHPNTKLAAIEIRADDKDPHYFNVKYTLSSLSLPMKSTNSDSKKR